MVCRKNGSIWNPITKVSERTLEIDRRTSTIFWRDEIALEVKNVGVAVDDLEDDAPKPIGAQFIEKCHWVFTIKIGTLKRKAQLVAGGPMTKDPNTSTYASVVSRESVRIGSALNGLDISSADIQNAYLTSPCQGKVCTILGPELDAAREGKRSIIARALFGLKPAGASFQNHLVSCLTHLGYEISKGDPDVWLKPVIKPLQEEYYEYLLVCTDDILAIGVNPKEVLDRLNKYFSLKPESIQPPDNYLGTKIKKVVLPNGCETWGQSSLHYIQAAVTNVEKWMQEHNMSLPRQVKTLWLSHIIQR